jgi:hypothetical protein
METYLRAAECILRRSDAPALHLTELLREVRLETRDLTLDAARLETALQRHPNLFRVLDPWRGPWRFLRSPDGSSPAHELDAWVVVVSDPGDGDGVGRSGALRLRACVRWLARGVDRRSPRAVARWSAMAMSAEAARNALRPAA